MTAHTATPLGPDHVDPSTRAARWPSEERFCVVKHLLASSSPKKPECGMENTYFRAIGLLVLALMCGMAAAQYDTGVEIEADEFTGEVSCRHTVFVSSGVPQGVSLHRSEGRTLVFIVRREVNYEPAFNMFGLVGGELIYVRWPDGTVDQYEPIAAEFSSDRDMEIGVIADHQLALKLMASPDNVRVRFDGPNRNADFTIAHDVVVALAQGFGQECLE